MRRPLVLLLWLAGILFPLAGPGILAGPYRDLFDRIFRPEWVHVAMHTFLFGTLACLLAGFLDQRNGNNGRWRTSIQVLGVVLVVALLQEAIQLWSRAGGPSFDDLFDVGVDLTGASLGLLALRVGQHFSGRLRSSMGH